MLNVSLVSEFNLTLI